MFFIKLMPRPIAFYFLKNREDIEAIEMELINIKQEMCEMEDKLNHLMSIDTTQLYFNVDNMKKLTEVSMFVPYSLSE